MSQGPTLKNQMLLAIGFAIRSWLLAADSSMLLQPRRQGVRQFRVDRDKIIRVLTAQHAPRLIYQRQLLALALSETQPYDLDGIHAQALVNRLKQLPHAFACFG